MANFTTHSAAGTLVAGALATLTLAADVVAQENLVAVTLVGVLGAVLPDIDLKDSRPSRALFAGLGIFFSFAVLFTYASRFSIAELWVLWLGTLLFVRYGMQALFHNLAVHRGVWHSLLAAVFVSILTAIVFAKIMGKPEGVAWLAAGFMFDGYIEHQILDEMYSVDVMDTRLKTSFGTALKLVDMRHKRASLAMAAATAAAVMLAPSTTMFVEGISSRPMWAGLSQRLWPNDKWFGVVAWRRDAMTAPAATSPITTGSIPEKPVPSPVLPTGTDKAGASRAD